MHKRNIKFKDFDDNDCVETHWFHLSKTDLVRMDVKYEDGLKQMLEKVVAAQNKEELLDLFEKIVLLSYGIRHEGSNRFEKTEDLRVAFSQTLAYDSLLMELASDDKVASEFVIGIFPKDMVTALEGELKTVTAEATDKPPVVVTPTETN